MSDLYKCIKRLTNDSAMRMNNVDELTLYINARGIFGNELVILKSKNTASG